MVDVPLAATPEGIAEDDWLAACSAVRAYCGWHVAPSVTETVTVDGSGSSVQLLPTLHLTALLSITNAGIPVFDPEWSDMGAVRGCWTAKYRGVEASIAHGYPQCPAEVLAVARAAAARIVSDRASQAAGGAVQQVGQVRYVLPRDGGTTAAGWDGPSYEAGILDRYRIPARP